MLALKAQSDSGRHPARRRPLRHMQESLPWARAGEACPHHPGRGAAVYTCSELQEISLTADSSNCRDARLTRYPCRDAWLIMYACRDAWQGSPSLSTPQPLPISHSPEFGNHWPVFLLGFVKGAFRQGRSRTELLKS